MESDIELIERIIRSNTSQNNYTRNRWCKIEKENLLLLNNAIKRLKKGCGANKET